MDPNRQAVLRGVVKALRSSRRAGVVYLAADGRRPDSQWRWPWPVDPGERGEALRQVVEQMDKAEGAHLLSFCEEGVPLRRGYRCVWPGQSGLFEQSPGKDAGYEWAFRELEADGVGPAKEVPEPAAGYRTPEAGEPEPVPEPEDAEGFEVCWPGVGSFTLTAPQREVFSILVDARIHGNNPSVGQDLLLFAAGSQYRRLESLFAGSPAWGTLIVPGRVAGTYCVPEPPLDPEPEVRIDQEEDD